MCPIVFPEGVWSFVMWDYHVILLQLVETSTSHIWDLDSTLPFPCPFDDYWNETIRPAKWNIPAKYSRYFRVISCAHYLAQFSSDRSHMKRQDGTWLAPPPSWELICRNGQNNIEKFISMDPNVMSEISTVLSEDEMFRKYSTK
ncbi:hypothetical protein DICVIV_08683 [Dictyocaulus viviparus]|uniref:Protein N-terminal glutamine amidohydrolase n=1 Tax=Dictyocaulus viviparus TaxID=29172 RepID=A0A0D8XNF7_DICVI|nr:hypothetical protein DICVIV_08683 [Dictyocaulus viviparus]